MPELLSIIVVVALIYLAIRRLAYRKMPGVAFDADPAELGTGKVTREFVNKQNDEWIGQILFDGVKWSAVLEGPQNGVPSVGSKITVVRILNRSEGYFYVPMAEVRWSSAMPPT